MNSTNEIVDNGIYEDSVDCDIVKRGQDVSAKDIERYCCVRAFIETAYYNVFLALNKVLRENGITDEQIGKFEFHHGHEDSDDNHSGTMERFWSFRIVIHGENTWYRLWFPCKLFWKPRSEICEWFRAEDKGYPQILAFKIWLSNL